MLMEFFNNIFDAFLCSFLKCLLNRNLIQSYTIEWSLLKCIYQGNNKTMLLSFEQRDDTKHNSLFLIYWLLYLVYCFEEILMRFGFCQFRSIFCQIPQITIIVFDLLKHLINYISSLEKQCSKCGCLCILSLI